MTGRGAAALLALALAAGAVVLLTVGRSPSRPLEAGVRAPAFRLPSLAGEEVSLEELRGRAVLLNFWATWCKPCEDEMPAMERLHRQLGSDGLALLAISVDTSPEDVEAFRGRLGLSFPILLDPQRRVADAYQAFRFPETWLIDREGILVARFIGPKDWDAPAYVDRIRSLLGAGGAGEGS
jgi:peroxiredoxin